MISISELNPENIELKDELADNFQKLFFTMNAIRIAYNKSMIINRGVSTEADQARINPACPHDAHVKALGCDVADNDKDLWNWCIDNLDFLSKMGVYLESKVYTPKHVHFQLYPPASGNRIFIP